MKIHKRFIETSIILTVITFGFYYIYWQFLAVRNVRYLTNDKSSIAGELLCLYFIPLYPLYWWYTRGETARQELKKRGQTALGCGTAYMLLSLIGLGIIALAIMQNDFNAVQDGNVDYGEKHMTLKSIVVAVLVIGIVVFIVAVIVINRINEMKEKRQREWEEEYSFEFDVDDEYEEKRWIN